MYEELIKYFLYKFPEAVLLIASALGLLGLRLKPGRLISAGLALGIIAWVARHFLLGLWLHTPVILVGLVLVLIVFFRVKVNIAIIGCFIGYFLLSLGETLLLPPVMSWTKVTFQQALDNTWLYIGFGWISSGFLLIASLLTQIWGLCLIRVPEASRPLEG